jgi:hypothetical protein
MVNHTEKEWAAIQILKETKKRYYIEWDGINPNTQKPWDPTWEPKKMANKALVDDWKERKKNKKRNHRRPPPQSEKGTPNEFFDTISPATHTWQLHQTGPPLMSQKPQQPTL